PSVSEVDGPRAFALEADEPRLASHLEGLDQVDHPEVAQAPAESSAGLSPLEALLLRLLEDHPRPGDDLFDVDGFRQVVLAAHLEAADLEFHGLLAGEEDERDVLQPLVGLEPAAELETVQLREPGVGEHQVRGADLDLLERIFSVGSGGD